VLLAMTPARITTGHGMGMLTPLMPQHRVPQLRPPLCQRLSCQSIALQTTPDPSAVPSSPAPAADDLEDATTVPTADPDPAATSPVNRVIAPARVVANVLVLAVASAADEIVPAAGFAAVAPSHDESLTCALNGPILLLQGGDDSLWNPAWNRRPRQIVPHTATYVTNMNAVCLGTFSEGNLTCPLTTPALLPPPPNGRPPTSTLLLR